MEFKFLRLFDKRFDYEPVIHALKGYQFKTHCRPINIQLSRKTELPEQTFLREWAADPQPVTAKEMTIFVDKVERGLLEESGVKLLAPNTKDALQRMVYRLDMVNRQLKSADAVEKRS